MSCSFSGVPAASWPNSLQIQTRGVSHYGLAIYIKKVCILRQKKNYGTSNISPCKNIIFKKSSERNQNPSRYYNSRANLKSFNTSQNIIFHKSSSYKNRPVT
jgi:hypothetical protein